MKKIFLLSLLSVFFLSAFCQNSNGATEVLAKINITKFIDDSELPSDFKPYRWNFYRFIISDPMGPGISCTGYGRLLCLPMTDIKNSLSSHRGMPTDAIEKTCENMFEESDALVANGGYKGSLTKKIAFTDAQSISRQSYILLQMNWDNDPKKPYNGKVEIIVSKTDNLGIK